MSTQVPGVIADMGCHSPRLQTIRQFAEKHTWATEGGLRWQRFNCKTNGFESAFVNVGRRVLIDEEEYFRCIRRQNRESGRDLGVPSSPEASNSRGQRPGARQ